MMRLRLAACCALLLGTSSCVEESQRWRPQPISGATEPSEVIARSAAADWQEIAAEDLLVMDLGDNSRIVIQLAPQFAPVHVSNIRAFARGGWWNASTIYRVQDNYVVQWGNGEAEVPLPAGVQRTPPAEYEQPAQQSGVRWHDSPDAYAQRVGFIGGWPVATGDGSQWLVHCYATVGVGRDLAPDTGTGGELYAVIGHAPRHLDRNIANVGRVIEGMGALAARPRGTGNLGFYQVERGERPIPITRIRVASDMPAAERPRFEMMRTESEAFGRYLIGRANRGGTFFNRPAGGVDICNAPVPVRRKAG
jgi:peptidylprolyl isomerase